MIDSLRPRLHVPALADMDLLRSAADRVHERWPQAVKPDEKDPEGIAERIRRRIDKDDWRDATVAGVVRSARVVFDAPFRDRNRLRSVRDFYYAEVRVSSKSTFLDAMMSVYLSTYEPGEVHTKELARALAGARGGFGAEWTKLRNNLAEFLDPKSAHTGIAQRMRRMEDPWTELRETGIDDPHGPGLMYHAHLAYLGYIRDTLRTLNGIDRLANWLRPDGRPARADGAVEAIEAFLSPWLDGDPPDELRDHLVEQLLLLYGDPRRDHGTVWATVGRRLHKTVLRWITGESIRFFLDVVSAVETSHMWEPRREFWLGLYEDGLIESAWVAFSPDGKRVANQQRRRHPGEDGLAFGEQTAGGSRSNTSLLILRIGQCIVVEGSHNYKVHVFRSSNPRAPRMFQRRYDCERIRLTPGAKAQAHVGYWQDRVREMIGYYS